MNEMHEKGNVRLLVNGYSATLSLGLAGMNEPLAGYQEIVFLKIQFIRNKTKAVTQRHSSWNYCSH